MGNITEEPGRSNVKPGSNPPSVTWKSRLMELSRVIHMSNQHTLNAQKTEHGGKLDAKSANLEKRHTDLYVQLAGKQAAVAAFVCIYSYDVLLSEAVGFQQLPGKQAGWVYGKKSLLCAWSSPHADSAVCPWHSATCRQTCKNLTEIKQVTCMYFPERLLQKVA